MFKDRKSLISIGVILLSGFILAACEPSTKIVFVTDSLYTGNLGGLLAADQICQDEALDAGLPGVYKAWLSDSNESPSTRFNMSTAPYALVDGTRVANNWADLADGSLRHPINQTATGGAPPYYHVWTNTGIGGVPIYTNPSQICNNWATAEVGISGYVGQTIYQIDNWTQDSWDDCYQENTLYCFQQ